MKASELMIGDWVAATCKENIPPVEVFTMLPRAGRVVGIEADCIHLDFCDFGFMPQDLDTVQLTPEILEKSGFKSQGCYKFTYTDNYCSIEILCVPDESEDGEIIYTSSLYMDGATFRITITIEYVHELQHALRLCGIDQGIVL